MQPFAQIVERDLADVFDREELFFDLLDRFGICVFDLFRQPVSFDDVKNDHAHHDDEK